MKLKDVRDAYYTYTGKASDILRYLGLAGIGIVWVFKSQIGDKFSLPKGLIIPTILMVVGLILDVLQYITGSIIWGAYNRHKEKQNTKENEEFLAPRKLNWPTNFLFWAKFVSITLAYCLVLSFLKNLLT
jgi:hypothetical protein